MAVDPITLEVLRNKFDVIANEMQIALLRSAFSSNIKEANDASSALFSVHGETIAQATSIPAHLGFMVPVMQKMISLFPVDTMVEGDVFIMNDPYDGASHLPDIIVAVPIHYQGRVECIAGIMAHNQDVGGKSPGSVPTDATELFQEGIVIPPLRFYDAGKPNETLHAMIRKNVRLPETVMGDLHSQIAAGNVGKARIGEILDEYGQDTFRAAIDELLDRAEAMTREVLSTLPDGTYTFTDYLDNDGVVLDELVKIRAAITVKGSDITFDYTGSGAQTRGPVNSVPSNALAPAYYWVKAITDPTIPNNSGCARMLHFVLPEGSVVNPRHPAPVSARGATMIRMNDVVQGALAQVWPERVPAAPCGQTMFATFAGTHPDTGRPYVTCEMGAGGTGARLDQDGLDILEVGISNTMNVPSEAFETSFPLRIHTFRIRRDSGGIGRRRGGLGYEKVFEAAAGDVYVSLRGERYFTQPWGVHGGGAGAPGQGWIDRVGGTREEIRSKKEFTLHTGDKLTIYTPGGGGYGDPLTREPELVQRDVLDGRVSPEVARDGYGVVLGAAPEHPIDAAATTALRGEKAAERGEITWTFDHGRHGRTNDGELNLTHVG